MRRDAGFTALEVSVAVPIAALTLSLSAMVVARSMDAAEESLDASMQIASGNEALDRIESLLSSATRSSFECSLAETTPAEEWEQNFTNQDVLLELVPAEKKIKYRAIFFRVATINGQVEPIDTQAPRCLFLTPSSTEGQYSLRYFDGRSTTTIATGLSDLTFQVRRKDLKVKLSLVAFKKTDRTAKARSAQAITEDTDSQKKKKRRRTFKRTVLIRL